MNVRHETRHETREEAVAAADAYRISYPPRGYDTITTIYWQTRGYWIMSADRAESCD